jgi:hypothetical protein
MVTLRQFKAKVNSYGADLERWPDALRGEAQTLLRVSPQAREILEEALALDKAIEAASGREIALLWRPSEQEAALTRLRAGVTARMAASTEHRPAQRRFGWLLSGMGHGRPSLSLRLVGMATASGFAIMVGLLLGAMYTAAPSPDTVLTMLQAEPIHIFAE